MTLNSPRPIEAAVCVKPWCVALPSLEAARYRLPASAYGWALEPTTKLVDVGEAAGDHRRPVSIASPAPSEMRTSTTGLCVTAESGVWCVPTKPLRGVVEFGPKARLRPFPHPHGVEAQVFRNRLHLAGQVRRKNQKAQKLISTPGSILFRCRW